MDKVLLQKHEGFAVVTLNRPEAMNALSRELRADFVDAFRQICEDPSIRVAIVTGNGRAFCAGFDLAELGNSQADPSQESDNTMARAMERFPGPIIGAINGHAVTGGFELALACDVLIASEDARFADTHARVGILPGWGLSQKLPRMIGLSRAKQIAFTAKPVFAQQALDWGLVNEVVPAGELLDRAMAMARDMCACVPEILLQYKAQIDEGYSMPLAEALLWEERRSIESASRITAHTVAERRGNVIEKGRSETSPG
jgi:enoyl-CoA hydratase